MTEMKMGINYKCFIEMQEVSKMSAPMLNNVVLTITTSPDTFTHMYSSIHLQSYLNKTRIALVLVNNNNISYK